MVATVSVLQLIELATKTQGGISRKELAETVGCNPKSIPSVRRLIREGLVHYDYDNGSVLVATRLIAPELP